MALSSGHTACPLEDEVQEQYNKDFPGAWNDIVRLQPGGWIVAKRYLQLEKAIYNFKFRPDDVLVMTYPKCGTTWTQEVVWNMRNNPDLDNPDVEDALFIRSPYIELDMLIDPSEMQAEEHQQALQTFLKGIEKYCPNIDPTQGIMTQVAEGHTKGRTLKTHLPFSFFPKSLIETCKVVYVTRNIKDQVLSALHHYRLVNQHGFTGTLSTFVDYYVKDLLLYGSYGKHMREAWKNKDHPNFHMLFFEDLKGDTLGQLKKLDKFVGTKLTDEQFQNLAQSIRYLLEFTGTEYEEKLYDIGGPPDYDSSQWTDVKETLGLKFPNLPYYIDGDLKMTESGAILRYLARKNKMAGTTEEDFITIDVASGLIGDQHVRFAKLAYGEDFETAKGPFIENIDTPLKKLSDLIGSQDYILGDKITFVDFQLFELLERYQALVPTCLSGFSTLSAFKERIKSLPAIKKYLASPVFLKMKDRFNGRSAKFGVGTY